MLRGVAELVVNGMNGTPQLGQLGEPAAQGTVAGLVEGALRVRLDHAADLAARKYCVGLSLRRLAALHRSTGSDDPVQFVAEALLEIDDALRGFEPGRDREAAAALLDLAFDGCCAVADTGSIPSWMEGG